MNNSLKTREELIQTLKQMILPLEKMYSEQGSFLHLGNTGAYFTDKTAQMEGFSRIMWALGPLWSHDEEDIFLPIYLKGLINGTDPNSEGYWGEVVDFDQKIVEMAAISLAITLSPEKIWKPLKENEKNNLYNWLNKINEHEIPDNNWLFFRILVNSSFILKGLAYNEERLKSDFLKIESYYLSDGWYFDGAETQIDYYVAFGMHFYGLVYSKIMKDHDKKRSAIFIDRAKLFAKDFMYWFSNDGSSIPYGRSLTYRFAQCCFFSALVYAEVDILSLGVSKGIIFRNFRYWLDKPIFDKAGILTIGYEYPNLFMSEAYNSPGSPYWSFKSFLILALNKEHAFWKAEELKLPKLDTIKVLKHARMIITRDEENDHVTAFVVGQHAKEHGNCASKYEKFVYSNKFGISVPRGNTIDTGAFDNTLAISLANDNFYKIKYGFLEYEIFDNYIYEKSKYMNGVIVETYLIPFTNWHVRVHVINTDFDIDVCEGGFAINGYEDILDSQIIQNENSVFVNSKYGVSGIVDETGKGNVIVVKPFPNTNLINPRTVLPMITHNLKANSRHVLVSSVVGYVSEFTENKCFENKPVVVLDGDSLDVKYNGVKVFLKITK